MTCLDCKYLVQAMHGSLNTILAQFMDGEAVINRFKKKYITKLNKLSVHGSISILLSFGSTLFIHIYRP